MEHRGTPKGRAAVVVFSYYPADPRVRRETEALASLGIAVDVFCLRAPGERASETYGTVSVYRPPLRRKRAGKLGYILRYCAFTALVGVRLAARHLRNPYCLVHVHNMPDFLVFSALVPRAGRAAVLLDLHDPMPEVFMTKYGLREDHPAISLLKGVERASIAFAHAVVTPNEAFRKRFVQRGTPREKITIVMNSPQESVFHPVARPAVHTGSEGCFRVMFHGTVVERHGLDTALLALAEVRKAIPNLRFDVFGTGDFLREFLQLAAKLKASPFLRYHGHVSLETIARAIPKAHVGLIPNKLSPFTELNFPTRIFEYLCLGKPVIAPRTEGILDYFTDKELFFFEPGEVQSLARALLQVYRNPSLREEKVRRAMAVYRNWTWEKEAARFRQLLCALLRRPPPAQDHSCVKEPRHALVGAAVEPLDRGEVARIGCQLRNS